MGCGGYGPGPYGRARHLPVAVPSATAAPPSPVNPSPDQLGMPTAHSTQKFAETSDSYRLLPFDNPDNARLADARVSAHVPPMSFIQTERRWRAEKVCLVSGWFVRGQPAERRSVTAGDRRPPQSHRPAAPSRRASHAERDVTRRHSSGITPALHQRYTSVTWTQHGSQGADFCSPPVY